MSSIAKARRESGKCWKSVREQTGKWNAQKIVCNASSNHVRALMIMKCLFFAPNHFAQKYNNV